MSRRTFVCLAFVLTVLATSALYYFFCTWVQDIEYSMQNATRGAVEHHTVDRFDLYLYTLLVTTICSCIFLLVLVGFGYIYSAINCHREVRGAIAECEKDGGVLFNTPKICHWYGYSWMLIGVLPDDSEFFRRNTDDFLANLPFVRSDF